MLRRLTVSLACLTLLVALTGCATIERAEGISPETPIDTLMVTTFVDIATQDAVNLGSGAGAHDIAMAMMSAYAEFAEMRQNDFNAGFTKPINDFLRSEGFDVVIDGPRAKRADDVMTGFVASQGQVWTHPEGATKHFNNRVFAGSLYADIAAAAGKGGREAFASLYVLVAKQDAFMGEIPVVSIDIEIYDQAGEKVFTASGRGEGEKASRLDLSPRNLRIALDAALQAMLDSRG